MKKLFLIDIRRLLQNKTAIIISLAVPVVIVALIAVLVAPYFFSGVRTNNFSVAVWCEDDDPLTRSILKGLIESESLGGLISAKFVNGESEGFAAVENGAAAYVHIPDGMQDALRSGGRAQISYYGNRNMPLEDALLFETLNSGVKLVSHAQHALNVLYFDSVGAGMDESAAAAKFTDITRIFFLSVLSRSSLYGDSGLTSPLGDALPLQYYAVSFLILFIGLGAIPIAGMTADDHSTGLIHRQLLSGSAPVKCLASRWLAGSLFLFMQYLILSSALCAIGSASGFAGNALLILVSGLLLCSLVSIFMILAGVVSRQSHFAVRFAFLGVLALSLAGGLIVPSAYMPGIIRDISYYTPFSFALKLGISGMFGGQAQGLALFAGLCLAYIAAAFALCVPAFQRRTN